MSSISSVVFFFLELIRPERGILIQCESCVIRHNAFVYFQVYKDRNVVAQLVKKAEKAGFKAIALTVDTPWLGRREADIKNR